MEWVNETCPCRETKPDSYFFFSELCFNAKNMEVKKEEKGRTLMCTYIKEES
jgi:hypothetical protein